MPSRIHAVQECDARDDDSSTAARQMHSILRKIKNPEEESPGS
ncbi:MAG: hypothetical protein WDN26_20310 [Chitinophagaceae bacterium]